MKRSKASDAAPNNGMHPTADTMAVMYINRAGRRVMPGVRSLERAGLLTWALQPGALERPNSGMHPTADTVLVMSLRGVARRVMPALGR